MGRQWLHAKREVANLRKGQAVGKLVKEIMVAAKLGGPDPEANARLFAAVEKARKASVTRDVIERAIKKGAGVGDDKLSMEHVVFEGYAPHKVPVIVEVLTDNNNRPAPEIRALFKKGQLGQPGSNKFLFDHVAIVEAHHADPSIDLETAVLFASSGDSVFVVENGTDPKSGQPVTTARQALVKLGETRGDFVEVLDGLKPGDTVAGSGVFKLRTGTALEINNVLAPKAQLKPRPDDA